MLKRRPYGEDFLELTAISNRFRAAYINKIDGDEALRQKTLEDLSIRGVEILRALSLSLRNEKAFGVTEVSCSVVGAIKTGLTEAEINDVISNYSREYTKVGYRELHFHEVLNKIAHMHPTRSSFFVD